MWNSLVHVHKAHKQDRKKEREFISTRTDTLGKQRVANLPVTHSDSTCRILNCWSGSTKWYVGHSGPTLEGTHTLWYYHKPKRESRNQSKTLQCFSSQKRTVGPRIAVLVSRLESGYRLAGKINCVRPDFEILFTHRDSPLGGNNALNQIASLYSNRKIVDIWLL